MPTGQRMSDETKQEVLRRAAKGEKVSDLAEEFGFHPTSFSKWKRASAKPNSKPRLKVSKSTRKKQPDVVVIRKDLIYFKGGIYKKVNEY